MDGAGVGYLRRVKQAISVARAVMEHTAHTLLAGNGATAFAKMMGFPETNLSTPHSEKLYTDWRAGHCQPNYFRDVVGQNSSCPPYKPLPPARCSGRSPGAVCEAGRARPGRTLGGDVDAGNHDTIGMIVLDGKGHMAAGTTTNGANHKVAGCGRSARTPLLTRARPALTRRAPPGAWAIPPSWGPERMWTPPSGARPQQVRCRQGGDGPDPRPYHCPDACRGRRRHDALPAGAARGPADGGWYGCAC